MSRTQQYMCVIEIESTRTFDKNVTIFNTSIKTADKSTKKYDFSMYKSHKAVTKAQQDVSIFCGDGLQ